MRLLVVDRDALLRRKLAGVLLPQGWEVLTAESGEAALALMSSKPARVALVDGDIEVGGEKLFERLRRARNAPEVVVMAAQPSGALLERLAEGSCDFLSKGPGLEGLVVPVVQRALQVSALRRENQALERRASEAQAIVGEHRYWKQTLRMALQVATLHSPVFLWGEPGTGKKLLARAIHEHSPRSHGELVLVGCTAYEAGPLAAGLGLGSEAEGTWWHAARGGTLCLDGVEALPAAIQAHLAGLLREPGEGDPRVLAISQHDPQALVQRGQLSRELHHRLGLLSVWLPPLRQRKDDIPLLAHHFLTGCARRTGREVRRLSPEATRLLRAQRWPDNVRQLQACVEQAVLLCRSETIFPGDLSVGTLGFFPAPNNEVDVTKNEFSGLALPPGWDELPYADAKEKALDAFHAMYLGALLKRTGGNISEAARRAGLDRSNFRRVLKRYGNPLSPKPTTPGPANE